MLRKFTALIAAGLMLASSVGLAHAANREENATWAASNDVLTLYSRSGTYRFGEAGSAGSGSACSSGQISYIVNSYSSSATRRIPAVGDIYHLIRQLENREHGDGIWWEMTDCGAPLGGTLSGLLCIDFEDAYQDRERVFEACANVTQVNGRRRIPVAGADPVPDRRIPVLGSVNY